MTSTPFMGNEDARWLAAEAASLGDLRVKLSQLFKCHQHGALRDMRASMQQIDAMLSDVADDLREGAARLEERLAA